MPAPCAGNPCRTSWPLPADLAPITPEQALASGRWVKVIGGASNQDLEALEDLAGLFTLAGVHCLDVAADPAVVAATRRGIAWAQERGAATPWLMVSLSDGADPHFRKAWFDPQRCPASCPRPCERVCPALAIPPRAAVLEERCYGCGRCLPACPHGLITERQHVLPAEAVAPLLRELCPDAVELHTRIGRQQAFAERVQQLQASGLPLKRVAVSCGLESSDTIEALAASLWHRHQRLRQAGFLPLWQLDGRPMSGDVGAGTAHAAVQLLDRVHRQAPPGPLQLAGGTNASTLPLLRRRPAADRVAAGVAFGGVARSLLQERLLEAHRRASRLLDAEDLWPGALDLARSIVQPWLLRSVGPAR